MYEDIKYGGFYTITGKSKSYVYISGTDEWGNIVKGAVPVSEFYNTFKEVG